MKSSVLETIGIEVRSLFQGTRHGEQPGGIMLPWNCSPQFLTLVKTQGRDLNSWKGVAALPRGPRSVSGMGLTFTEVAPFILHPT